MGQTLSEPITTKNTAACSNTRYSVGSSSMQGWRINMEDAHVHLLEVGNDPSTAYFAVFDGHGGSRIAKHASLFLHKQITDSEAYAEGRITEALIDGFLTLDERMRENAELREEMSGSTAVVVLIKNNSIYCANAGDSRAVVSVSGRAVPLSIDHKPSNEEESRRIFNAGGWVEFNRVNGNLALSRALGDFAFKNNDNMSAREQIVTACPEVETQAITADHEFIILACDGIWDVMGSQEVIDFCRVRLASGIGPEKICEELLNKCLAPDCELSGLGCDNMTAILVCLLQDLTQEEYKQQLQKSAPQPVYIDSTWQPPAQPTAQTDELVDAPVSNTEDSESGEEIFATPSHSPPVVLEEERANESPEDEERPPTFFKVPCESEQEKPPEEMIIEPQSQEQERFDER